MFGGSQSSSSLCFRLYVAHLVLRVFTKLRLKEIEAVVTVLALVWPDLRPHFHILLRCVEGIRLNHLRNFVLLMDFFIPLVGQQHSFVVSCLCILVPFFFAPFVLTK